MNELQSMLEGSFKILRNAYSIIIDTPPEESIKPLSELSEKNQEIFGKKEKKDTINLDIIAERALSGSDDINGNLDIAARIFPNIPVVWVTEERGKVVKREGSYEYDKSVEIHGGTPLFISDPIDQSSSLTDIVKKHTKNAKTIGSVFDNYLNYLTSKGRKIEAAVAAPNVSFTFIRQRSIIYTMVLNLVTSEVYVAHAGGILTGKLNDKKESSLSDLTQGFEFNHAVRKPKENLNMVCYASGEKYLANLEGTSLTLFQRITEIPKPVGPLRFRYLSKDIDEELTPVGLIAYNGEKVQELLPSVAMAYFSQGELWVWKLLCDQDYIKQRAGKDMTPHLGNSLFGQGPISRYGIEPDHMSYHRTPNNFRDTVVITTKDNAQVNTMMAGLVNPETGLPKAIRII